MIWRPIETAPRSKMILGAYDGMIRLVFWEDGWTVVGRNPEKYWFSPTHWTPIPDPPESSPLERLDLLAERMNELAED